MTNITQKELDKIIKKNLKSEYQNCFQCQWIPKKVIPNNILFSITKQISRYYWNRENIEVIVFRCEYLRKRNSQSIKPFQSNHCLCFRKSKSE